MLKTPKQIAEEYGFSASHIRKLINQGRIKAERVGKFYAINPDAMLDLKRRRKPNRFNKEDDNGSHK